MMAACMASCPSSTGEVCRERGSPVEQKIPDGGGRQILPLCSANELADPHVGRYQSQLRRKVPHNFRISATIAMCRIITSWQTERTSNGTDTQFASSVMGPCSSGRARKTTATERPADMPAQSIQPPPLPSATGSGPWSVPHCRFR